MCNEEPKSKQESASLIICRDGDTIKTGVPQKMLLLTAHACSEECLARHSSPKKPQAAGSRKHRQSSSKAEDKNLRLPYDSGKCFPNQRAAKLDKSGADELAVNIQP
jgi:hypothetical protein